MNSDCAGHKEEEKSRTKLTRIWEYYRSRPDYFELDKSMFERRVEIMHGEHLFTINDTVVFFIRIY